MSMFYLLLLFLRLPVMTSIYLLAITITIWLPTPDAFPAEGTAADEAAQLSFKISSEIMSVRGTTLFPVTLPSEPAKRVTVSLRIRLTVLAAQT